MLLCTNCSLLVILLDWGHSCFTCFLGTRRGHIMGSRSSTDCLLSTGTRPLTEILSSGRRCLLAVAWWEVQPPFQEGWEGQSDGELLVSGQSWVRLSNVVPCLISSHCQVQTRGGSSFEAPKSPLPRGLPCCQICLPYCPHWRLWAWCDVHYTLLDTFCFSVVGGRNTKLGWVGF